MLRDSLRSRPWKLVMEMYKRGLHARYVRKWRGREAGGVAPVGSGRGSGTTRQSSTVELTE